MTITILSTAFKKRNSTLRPSGGTTVECVLKTPTNTLEPTFQISSNHANAKYVIWGSRYYFVDDVTYVTNDIVEVSCRLDSLATYKDQILNTTQLIERSATLGNPHITDPLNIPTLEHWDKTTRFTLDGLNLTNTGCYILTVMGAGVQSIATVGVGASQVYALSSNEILAFTMSLCAPDLLEALVHEFTNPMDALISCFWIPVALDSLSGITTEIYCGSQAMGISGKLLLTRFKTHFFEINVNDLFFNSPEIADFSARNYLQDEPYSNAIMFLPFVGVVKFPLSAMYKYEMMTMNAALDVMTGDIVYSFLTPTETYYGNCAMECPISAMKTNIKGTIQAMVEFIGMSAGNYIGSEMGTKIAETFETARFVGNTAPRGINALIGSFDLHSQHGGAISSGISAFLPTGMDVTVRVFSRVPSMGVNAMNQLFGRPYNAPAALSSLSGYCKCSGAVLNLSCEYEIRREIEYFLNSGFYIE